jgi:hypothetical protein
VREANKIQNLSFSNRKKIWNDFIEDYREREENKIKVMKE